MFGQAAPGGLVESAALPEPYFTPSTKAESGHDLPLSPDEGRALVGAERYERIRGISVALYGLGVERASQAGIIVADTKFEFGLDRGGDLVLMDEVMTPDSSRFWPADRYAPGGPQPSFDKQFVRDYLESCDWDKTPPPPPLPEPIVRQTRKLYLSAYRQITGDCVPNA